MAQITAICGKFPFARPGPPCGALSRFRRRHGQRIRTPNPPVERPARPPSPESRQRPRMAVQRGFNGHCAQVAVQQRATPGQSVRWIDHIAPPAAGPLSLTIEETMNAPHNECESRTQGQEVRRPRRKDRLEKSEGERESPLMAATLARMNEAFERSTKP